MDISAESRTSKKNPECNNLVKVDDEDIHCMVSFFVYLGHIPIFLTEAYAPSSLHRG